MAEREEAREFYEAFSLLNGLANLVEQGDKLIDFVVRQAKFMNPIYGDLVTKFTQGIEQEKQNLVSRDISGGYAKSIQIVEDYKGDHLGDFLDTVQQVLDRVYKQYPQLKEK